MPRTMRARVLGSCRRICTCYLRLIGSVLICMSFAAIDWSGRQDLHLRLPSSKPGGLLLTYVLRGWTRRQELHPREVACRQPPIAAQPRRDVGVTGWTCTSYGGVTARGLSASPSATNWYPRQDLHPHDSRHYVLSVACLLIPPRGLVCRVYRQLHSWYRRVDSNHLLAA